MSTLNYSTNEALQERLHPNSSNYPQRTSHSIGTNSNSGFDKKYSQSDAKKNEIALAKVSMAIVFIFIICHSVRWIPNVYELTRIYKGTEKEDWPPWIESLTHISHFLTTLNSSVNFYIYCFKHFSKSSTNRTNSCWPICSTNCCRSRSNSSLVVCLESQ